MLSGELVGARIVGGSGSGGTSDYEQLINKPSINGVTLIGNKTTEALGIVSEELDPTVPQYVKDITQQDISNWNSKATESYVDAKVAELVNSAPDTLNTLGELASAIESNKDLIDAIKVPTKTSELTNDSGFITADDIPQQDVDLTNYYTKAETQEYVQNYVDSLVGNINTELENVLGV